MSRIVSTTERGTGKEHPRQRKYCRWKHSGGERKWDIRGKKQVVVFHETQGGKEAVVRDEASEAAGVGHGRQREGRRRTWREEKNGSNGGLVGVGGRKTPGDFPLQRNENHSHF